MIQPNSPPLIIHCYMTPMQQNHTSYRMLEKTGKLLPSIQIE